MIKVILFDIGGVLVTDGFHKTSEWLSAKTGIKSEKIFEAYIKTDTPEYSSGKITKERWDSLFNELNLNVNHNEFLSFWQNRICLINDYDVCI